MNKTFIASLENHEVYLINTNKASFYFNISKMKGNTNITIDANYKKNNSVNDIITYYEKIDNYNITLVVPVAEFENEEKLFKHQSNVLSEAINCTHKFLTNNGVTVGNNINIIKHSTRSDFVDFFVNKFETRVRYISLEKLVQEEVPYNKVNAANISFVVGKPEIELTIKDDEMKEIINETQNINNSSNSINVKPKYSFASSGHVSYYLLGVLTAIVTLTILTLLVK